MHEIKMRVWDKQTREMHYGTPEVFDDMIAWRFGHFGPDRDIVKMLWTGFEDEHKNKNEIYEGDILECTSTRSASIVRVCMVEWCDSGGFWQAGPCYEDMCEVLGNNYVKVIGNVWENPELVEKVKEEYESW